MRNIVAFATIVNDKPVCHQILGFKVKKGNLLAKISNKEALDMGPFNEWDRNGGFLVRRDSQGALSMIEFVQLVRDAHLGFYCTDTEKAKAEDVLAQCVLKYQ